MRQKINITFSLIINGIKLTDLKHGAEVKPVYIIKPSYNKINMNNTV